MHKGYLSTGYLSALVWLLSMEDSYFRNNADLGTGLLMAKFALTSPHFFSARFDILPSNSLDSLRGFLHLRNYAHLGSQLSPWRGRGLFPEKNRANISELCTVWDEFPPGDRKENETDFCNALCAWYVAYRVVCLCSGR